MGQVIDYPDAPQGEVLRYDFAFYGEDYEEGKCFRNFLDRRH